jgi:hypothetical protein
MLVLQFKLHLVSFDQFVDKGLLTRMLFKRKTMLSCLTKRFCDSLTLISFECCCSLKLWVEIATILFFPLGWLPVVWVKLALSFYEIVFLHWKIFFFVKLDLLRCQVAHRIKLSFLRILGSGAIVFVGQRNLAINFTVLYLFRGCLTSVFAFYYYLGRVELLNSLNLISCYLLATPFAHSRLLS